MSAMPPWDKRLARILVRPLARTGVTANQVTTFTLALGLTGAALLATGDAGHADWGAGLFILSRFLDHFDGELARLREIRRGSAIITTTPPAGSATPPCSCAWDSGSGAGRSGAGPWRSPPPGPPRR